MREVSTNSRGQTKESRRSPQKGQTPWTVTSWAPLEMAGDNEYGLEDDAWVNDDFALGKDGVPPTHIHQVRPQKKRKKKAKKTHWVCAFLQVCIYNTNDDVDRASQ